MDAMHVLEAVIIVILILLCNYHIVRYDKLRLFYMASMLENGEITHHDDCTCRYCRKDDEPFTWNQ